jgi:hypothetical protein
VPPTVILDVEAPLGDAPVISFKAQDLSKKIKEAVAEGGNGALELCVTAADSVTSVQVEIPAVSIKEMIDEGLTYLLISGPLGSTGYDMAALVAMYEQGEGDKFVFIIRRVDPQTLDESLQAAVGNNILFEILLLRNNVPIEDFGAGQVTINLPYKLQAGQSAYGVKVWHLSKDAQQTEIESVYNSTQGYAQFARHSLSYYMVGYDAAAALWVDNPFKDVSPADWFYDNVRFVYERALMQGTAADTFSPNLATSRGMVVTILYRLENSPAINAELQAESVKFKDVPQGTWYTNAVLWAAENGIVKGYDDGRFGPNDSITREQMAAILYRYANFKGNVTELKDSAAMASFTDTNDISAYAEEALQWACAAGILQGSANKLDPKGRATRAQVAAILERFISGI